MTKRDLIQDTSEMNVIFIHSVVDDAGLTPSAFRVYAHLARRAGSGAAWPAVQGIADHCQLHADTVRAALSMLVDRNMIRAELRPGKTTRYFLEKPSAWEPLGKNHPPALNGDHPSGLNGGDPSGLNGDEGNKRRTSKEGNPSIVAEAPKSGQRKQIRDRTADELALARLIQPDLLASEVFKAAWTAWQGYREERATRPLSGETRTAWTERAAGAHLKNFLYLAQRYGDDALRRMVDRSIDRRWLEVYEPKGSDTIKASTTTMTEEQLKKF